MAPTILAKPSPSTLRHNWHKPSPEMSSRAEGGKKREAKVWMWDGVQINLHTQQSSQVYCQAAGLVHGVGGVNRNTPTTRTRNTHICHTRHTYQARPEHPLPAPGSQCSLQEGGRSKGSRPSIYRRWGDGRHSPLTERWNWTFFSGKTRRRDGTGKDTA